MNLFRSGEFTLNSGRVADFKIDCDALTDADLATLARVAARGLGPFGSVEGVPTGGLRFAAALEKHADPASGRVLITDDVLTTGGSMERQRGDRRHVVGVVVFARGECPEWVWPLFPLSEAFLEAV